MSGGGALGIAHLADVAPLGDGSGSSFYSARDKKLDRRIAVQVYPAVPDEEGRRHFVDRSRTVGQVSAHPAVATIYEAGFTADYRPFLILEPVDGPNLADVIRDRGPLPWTEAADIVLHLCAGLERAHLAGALHRNLRPEAVLMTGSSPRLIDFALAPDATPTDWNHVAPEAFDGVWNETTDLYSLASVLFHLIDGNPPFRHPVETSANGLKLRVQHQPPTPPAGEVPPAIAVFIAAALSNDPFDRPQSAAEFVHELRVIREGRTTGANASILHQVTGAVPVVAGVGTTTIGSSAPPDTVIPPPDPAPSPAPGVGDGATAVLPVADPGPAGPRPLPSPPPAALAAPPAPRGTGPGIPPPGKVDVAGFDIPPPGSDRELAPPAEDHLDYGHDGPRKSPLFVVALAILIIGVVGLGAIAMVAGLGENEPAAAPSLPDSNQPAVVRAEDGQPADGETGPVTTTVEPEAMADQESTTTTAPAEETTTTVNRVDVPSVIGMDVETASRALSDSGLQVIVISRVAPNAEPGKVAQQKPDPGASVEPPLSVTVYIPQVSTLPQMVGRQGEAVCAELVSLRLRCNQTQVNNSTVPAGSVISTNPAGGGEFSEGSAVEVLVSKGPVKNVAVPDVTGLAEADARAALIGAGFGAITAGQAPSADVAEGMAVHTEPAAGTTVASDRPVTIFLSSGPPPKVTVPTVVDQAQADAEAALSQVGLGTAITRVDLPAGDPGIGVVTATEPAGGAEVDAGATVHLTVGGQAPKSPPEG